MAAKLGGGDSFPALKVPLLDGGEFSLPGDLDGDYKIILFYRGHW